MQPEIFENKTLNKNSFYINIYADEIKEVENINTQDRWLYMGAVYERLDAPVLKDLIDIRYCMDKENWRDYYEKNDALIHWVDIGNDNNRKNIINRWFNYILNDCFSQRKIYFSLLGVNLSNLNLDEFGDNRRFSNIYNRFFRSMLQYSLKKFFAGQGIVKNIYHEEGEQSNHDYFDWHTIYKLDQDEKLSFECPRIEFLPKSHRDDERSNVIQLCDVLLGIFKDLHLGVSSTYAKNKKEILASKFVQDFLVKRIIRNPKNKNSSYNYSNRFHLSLFPKTNSEKGSLERLINNYYELQNIELAYFSDQLKLF